MERIQKKLFELLDNAADRYSKFAVSSIIITKDGKEYEGVNYESASYGGTICAERNAIGSAITDGMSYGVIREVHVMARNNNTGKVFGATPCGICRQIIAEQSDYKANITLWNDKGVVEQDTISTLLPKAFLGELL